MNEDWRTTARRRIAAMVFPKAHEKQRGAFEWLAFQQEFEFLVTVQFGEELREPQIAGAIKRFAAVLDSHWLGRSWAERASGDRTFFVATVERGKKGNSHVHMLLRRPRATMASAVARSWRETGQARSLSHLFTELGRRKGVCPHGDIRFSRLRNEDGDQVRPVGYVLKDFGGWNSTGLILSNEFHPQHSESPVTRNADRIIPLRGTATRLAVGV